MKLRNASPCFLIATLLACSTQDVTATKDKARDLADTVRNNVPTSTPDLKKTKYVAQLLDKVDLQAGLQAIHDQDLTQVTAFCSRLDAGFGTSIFSTYAKACERDLHSSTDLAIQILDAEIANVDLPPNDRAALEATRDAARKAKGLFNRDTFAALLIIYLESKYPHGQWAKFLAPLLIIKPLVADEHDK